MPLLFAPALLVGGDRRVLLFLLLVLVAVALVLRRRDPETGLAVLELAILAREVDALGLVPRAIAALRESPCASAELGLDGSILLDPVGQGIFTVLDDAAEC